jgi:hypothetical protein
MSTWKLLKKSEIDQNQVDEKSDSEPLMDPNFNYMKSDDDSDDELII